MARQTCRTETSAALPTPALASSLPSLTGMRWAAAFVVFVYHVRNFGYFGGEGARIVDWAFGAGATGVSFFFILSGFVLAWSARPGEGAWLFWRRRLARIYPVPLVTALVALVLAFTVVPGLRPSGSTEAVSNLLLVSSWNHHWWHALNPVSWSLTCEAALYAVFPTVYAGLRRLSPRGLTALAMACTGAVILLPWVNSYFTLGWTLHSFPLARIPSSSSAQPSAAWSSSGSGAGWRRRPPWGPSSSAARRRQLRGVHSDRAGLSHTGGCAQ
ncbi:acyltransferase family protein [Streptomyces sp. NPDC002659]|uniref:acyltransferase family protein n=1 Tax=Streptomyces sp. NPDC002659 TaxID=3364656 RepID=UPI0036C4052B